MNTRTALLSAAVISALALMLSSGAFAATRIDTPAATPASSLTTLAKHGADDAVESGDDNGVDFILAKNGADDAVESGDDNGVDFIIAKNGADDLVDGDDDRGVDFVRG